MSNNGKYFGNFSSYEGMVEDFSKFTRDDNWNRVYKEIDNMPYGDDILFASYGGESYTGDAVVIFNQDGQLYEVHGSHCSCNGLEGQWSPDNVTWESLALRIKGMEEPERYHFLYDHETEAQEAFKKLVRSHVDS